MRAFVAAGHDVAVITSSEMEPLLRREASENLIVLPAGPLASVTMTKMADATGVSPATEPVPPVIAEFFAGRQVDAGFERAHASAAAWEPDVIISEAMDHIGPLIAGELGVPFYRHSFGPTRPRLLTETLERVAAGRAAALGVAVAATEALIDIFPGSLQAPHGESSLRRIPLRPEIHHRPGADPVEKQEAVDPSRLKALVTFGTVFTDPGVREAAVESMDPHHWDLVITTGGDAGSGSPQSHPERRYVPFTPLGELLPGTDLVITAGGAGTVLSALIAGIPMVILPLGADHDINAARANAAGVALVVRDPRDIGRAATRMLSDPRYHEQSRIIAAQIAELPSADVVAAGLEREIAGRHE
ncbi:glycosyltransferase [Microbacterium sp. P05]|uniref:glycosyltransferase n=1 Tax=Microbacterium sp. P05 TaxID=3366948 RepID=UPI003745DC6A